MVLVVVGSFSYDKEPSRVGTCEFHVVFEEILLSLGYNSIFHTLKESALDPLSLKHFPLTLKSLGYFCC